MLQTCSDALAFVVEFDHFAHESETRKIIPENTLEIPVLRLSIG